MAFEYKMLDDVTISGSNQGMTTGRRQCPPSEPNEAVPNSPIDGKYADYPAIRLQNYDALILAGYC